MGWRRAKPDHLPDEKPLHPHEIEDEKLARIEKSELEKHTTEESGLWIVIGEKVFDVTRFMEEEHPGGKDVIVAFAGKQCDWQFELFHRPEHLEMYYDELVVGQMTQHVDNPFVRPPRELKADWRQE